MRAGRQPHSPAIGDRPRFSVNRSGTAPVDSDSTFGFDHEFRTESLMAGDHCRRGRTWNRPRTSPDPSARVEGANPLQVLLKVYVPLAKPIYLAYGLVSVSFHWNNFLWPLVVTNSVGSRPLTVGLQVFSSTDQGIDWSIITAATLMTSAPLLLAFLLFQRQFVQSFMRAGIR